MENKTKTNDQAFGDYYNLIFNTYSEKSLYEGKRLLGKFRAYIGEFPPDPQLGVQFLSQFQDIKVSSRARYFSVLNSFFKWYSGEELPLKIKQPKTLPQYVPGEEIDQLIRGIRQKKSHKKSVQRDVLLVEVGKMTGLRRGELANLKVGDLHLNGDDPVLLVRAGKGNKDRAVALNPYITNQLATFVRGKPHDESVFGLAARSITDKIAQWARKSGVPQIHTHSLRHYAGTTLFEKGANPRAIQVALGHESLETTMQYAAVVGKDIKQAMALLDDKTQCQPKAASSQPQTSEGQKLPKNGYVKIARTPFELPPDAKWRMSWE